jgi:hypothetical protein
MVFRQAASGKFPCEAVMAEASAALEAESVPWSKAWFRWLGAIENGRVFRRFSGKSWENHGKIMGKSWENDDNPSFLDFVWHVL